jgi:hypothetical protein
VSPPTILRPSPEISLTENNRWPVGSGMASTPVEAVQRYGWPSITPVTTVPSPETAEAELAGISVKEAVAAAAAVFNSPTGAIAMRRSDTRALRRVIS